MGVVTEEHRRAGRPVDSDSADTRARIVDHALVLFGTEGFDATTNRRIAKLVGISSAALYHYFPSKAEIYVAVCGAITDRFADVFARVTDAEPTLAGRLARIMDENIDLGRTAPALLGFVAGIPTAVQKHPEIAHGAETLSVSFRKMVRDMVEGGTEPDAILGGTPAAGFADLVMVVLSGTGRLSARGMHDRHRAASEAFLALVTSARGDRRG
ncbi:MAG: TetR/AcrR family transcriptional regulator [Actinomycetota bacterium]